jgi:hypothetical protein
VYQSKDELVTGEDMETAVISLKSVMLASILSAMSAQGYNVSDHPDLNNTLEIFEVAGFSLITSPPPSASPHPPPSPPADDEEEPPLFRNRRDRRDRRLQVSSTNVAQLDTNGCDPGRLVRRLNLKFETRDALLFRAFENIAVRCIEDLFEKNQLGGDVTKVLDPCTPSAFAESATETDKPPSPPPLLPPASPPLPPSSPPTAFNYWWVLAPSTALGFLLCAGLFLFAVSPRSRLTEREEIAQELKEELSKKPEKEETPTETAWLKILKFGTKPKTDEKQTLLSSPWRWHPA